MHKANMVKSPPTIESAAQIYRDLMEEVKLRIASYAHQITFVAADPEAPDSFLSAEYCYLQMRYLCELIALAALTANSAGSGDLPPKKLLSEWHPEQLFRRLESINRDCYPMPAEATRVDGRLHFNRSDAPFLERAELAHIYGRCGEALHRGSVGQIWADKRRPYDLGELQAWNEAVWHLLNQHFVLLPHLSMVLLVRLGDANQGASVVICAARHWMGNHLSSLVRQNVRQQHNRPTTCPLSS